MVDEAGPNELVDALNVWAPNGRVQQRPGYVGLPNSIITATTTNATGVDFIVENPLGTFTNTDTFSNLPVGSRWYFAFTNAFDFDDYISSLFFLPSAANSNSVRAILEYYNGTDWVGLKMLEGLLNGTGTVDYNFVHMSSVTRFYFNWPRDIAQLQLDPNGVNVTAYWLRFTLYNLNGGTAFDALTTVVTSSKSFRSRQPAISSKYFGTTKLQFSVGPRYINLYAVAAGSASSAGTVIQLGSELGKANYAAARLDDTLATGFDWQQSALNPVVVPGTDEAFVPTDKGLWLLHPNYSNYGAAGPDLAKVESRDFAVGPNAPFDKNFIAQLNDFPIAKYVIFYKNRLWFFGIEGQGSNIRWGASAPYYKVLPQLSIEPVAENDSSQPTGLAGLGEFVVAYKENSTSILVLNEINNFGLSVFRPIKKSDVGCVAHNSIKEVMGNLISLAKDGLYAFDGSESRKVSLDRDGNDRLLDFWARINASARTDSVACVWREQQYYLLAVPVDGSTKNNMVVAWDYNANTLWLWDDMEVKCWIVDSSPSGKERIYFADYGGRLYEFGVGGTDHGAPIESYIKTRHIDIENSETISVRQVLVTAENVDDTVNVELLADDNVVGASEDIDLKNYNEKDYDTAVYDTDSYTERRRAQIRLGCRTDCKFFQVKVTHNAKNKPFSLNSIQIGYHVRGPR